MRRLPASGRSNGAADVRECPIAFRRADVLQPPLSLLADYRYRIVGRLRLLLFWLTTDAAQLARIRGICAAAQHGTKLHRRADAL